MKTKELKEERDNYNSRERIELAEAERDAVLGIKDKRKYKIHVPTEQFGFIEVETDELVDAKAEYENIKRSFEVTGGLDATTWRKVLDNYLNTGRMEAVDYGEMNSFQRGVVQEIKKYFKRQ